MSELAEVIYGMLYNLVPSEIDPRITYKYLSNQLPPRFGHLRAHSREITAALAEITAACRRKGLPALPAIVVSTDSRMPQMSRYATAAHPEATTKEHQVAAWQLELEKVKRQHYPINLDD